MFLRVLPLVGLLVALAPWVEAQPSAPATYTPPAWIDTTGAADVTNALQQFIAEVPDGSVVTLPKGAHYRVDGTLTLSHRHDLVLDGNGATLRATVEGDRNRAQIRIDSGNDLRIHDLRIVGAHPDGGIGPEAYRPDRVGQQGIDLKGVTRIEIDHVTISEVFGDTIYVGRDENKRWSSQVWIHNSTLSRTGRHGITVTAGEDVVIEQNEVSQTRYSTIDLEPNSPEWGARNILIANNRIGPGRLLFLSAHGDGPVDEVVVTGNQLSDRILNISVLPPNGSRRNGFYIVGNTSDVETGRTPLTFERIDGLVIRDNRQRVEHGRARSGEVGVELTNVCGAIVADNSFGSGTTATKRVGQACGTPPGEDLPPPPDILARNRALAAAPAPPTTATPPAPVQPHSSGSRRVLIAWAIMFVGLGVVVMVGRRFRGGSKTASSSRHD